MGRLNSDSRGGLKDMITPYSRMPLKGDVPPFDPTPSLAPRDPLGNFPKGTLGTGKRGR